MYFITPTLNNTPFVHPHGWIQPILCAPPVKYNDSHLGMLNVLSLGDYKEMKITPNK